MLVAASFMLMSRTSHENVDVFFFETNYEDSYWYDFGDIVTSTFKLSNNGTYVAKDVYATFSIPKGLSFVSASVLKKVY